MIIKDTYRHNYYTLEEAVEHIAGLIRSDAPPQVIHTEMGLILIDVSYQVFAPTSDNIEVYRWGQEPVTDAAIEFRHYPRLDFYVQVRLPISVIKDPDIARSAAAKIMAEILIYRLNPDSRYVRDKVVQDVADAIVFVYGIYHHKANGGDAGIRALLRLEMRSRLRTLGARNRNTAEELFNVRWREREDRAQKLLDKTAETNDLSDLDKVFDGNRFWIHMFRFARYLANEISTSGISSKTSFEYLTTVKKVITWKTPAGEVEIPFNQITPYQFIVTLFTTSQLDKPNGWTAPIAEKFKGEKSGTPTGAVNGDKKTGGQQRRKGGGNKGANRGTDTQTATTQPQQ